MRWLAVLAITVVGWLVGVTPAAAASPQSLPVAYAYDALVYHQPTNYTASERAPPVELASSAGEVAVDHGSRGTSVRPGSATTHAYATYDVPTSLAHVDNSMGTTRGPAQATSGDLLSLPRWRVAAKGGVGPVLKGQAGVKQVETEIEAAGGKILGREITVEANGVRTRPDLFVEDACGIRCFVEVKNGPSAVLTKNQAAAFPWIQSTGFIPRGANAAAAGLTPGANYGPMSVWTVFLGG